jgi:hypothetical protein
MFRYTDEPRHPHPSDRIDNFAKGAIALAFASGAFALYGVFMFAGLIS